MKSSESEEEKKKEEEETETDWSEEFLKKELDENQLNDIWQGESELSMDDVDYSNQFWKKLQKEWEKMSKQDGDPTWEKEFSDFVDPFKVLIYLFLKMTQWRHQF